MVRLLLDAAAAHRERGDRPQAEILLEEALDVAQSQKQPGWIAAVRASQGVLERMRGNLDQAGLRLAEALQLRRSQGEPLGIARALGDLSGVHLAAGRDAEASRCLGEALEVSAHQEPGRTRAEVLEHAGRLHAKLGDRQRAESCFSDAREIYEQLGDGSAVMRVTLRRLKGDPTESGEKTLDGELSTLERIRLVEALDAEGWNQSRAARRLGVTETRVRNLMSRHGLRPRNRRGRPRKSPDRSKQ